MTHYALTDTISALLGVPVPDRGLNAMVRCPLHEDRHPSLSINLDNGLWKCHSCNSSGGLERLASLIGSELQTGVIAKAKANHVLQNEETTRNLTALATSLFDAPDSHNRVSDYLASRGLSKWTGLAFNLSYSRDHDAVAQPYWDGDYVVAIKYRAPDGRKFTEPGSRWAIYNVDDVRGAGTVVLCEGEGDTHRMWAEMHVDIGVGGIPGASANEERWETWALDLMFADRVYVAFDADEAGDAGAETALKVLGDKGRRLRPTRGKDMTDHYLNGGSLAELDGSDDLIRRLEGLGS